MHESHRAVQRQAGSQAEILRKRVIFCTLCIHMIRKLIRELSADVKLEFLNMSKLAASLGWLKIIDPPPRSYRSYSVGFTPDMRYAAGTTVGAVQASWGIPSHRCPLALASDRPIRHRMPPNQYFLFIIFLLFIYLFADYYFASFRTFSNYFLIHLYNE